MLQWLDDVRLKTYHYYLEKKVSDLKITRKSISFKNARSIGILLDATDRENQVFADKDRDQLRKMGKKVNVLAYFNDSLTHNNILFDYFNNKNLNWYYQPKSKKVEDFMNTSFDVLISLHLDQSPPLEFISACSKAHMRVGQYREDKEFCYDLMIDISDDPDLDKFVNEVDVYLKIINR